MGKCGGWIFSDARATQYDAYMIQKRLTISGMHCASCSLLIEGELMDIGVDAICNFVKGYVDVAFDEGKNSEKEIAEVITRLGYKVKPIV